ncbi:hypothetical protein MTP99_017518 [Tenebrio molitor]|jgi:hypothetical protein|nr:hypothetical protein MTP99_017518 [Tenebrio molitor]
MSFNESPVSSSTVTLNLKLTTLTVAPRPKSARPPEFPGGSFGALAPKPGPQNPKSIAAAAIFLFFRCWRQLFRRDSTRKRLIDFRKTRQELGRYEFVTRTSADAFNLLMR